MLSSSSVPCAACKFLRRKCVADCVFKPYFPQEQAHKFHSVHKVYGASNVAKLLNDLPVAQREDAVTSLAYEAEARLRDPIYGCVGYISILQHRLIQIQIDLQSSKQELATYMGPSGLMMNPEVMQQFPNLNVQWEPGVGQHDERLYEGQQRQLVEEAAKEQELQLQEKQDEVVKQYLNQYQDLMRFNNRSGFDGSGPSHSLAGPGLDLGGTMYENAMYRMEQMQQQEQQQHQQLPDQREGEGRGVDPML